MNSESTECILPEENFDGIRSRRSIRNHINQYTQSICSVSTLKKRVPICEWLPKYRFDLLIQDILAGITVGLTVIPQGIAYAVVAGLDPQYGLYSSFMGCFVYLVFGSCKDITIGPTAILSLMVHKYVSGFSVDYAILATFLGGVIIFVLGLLHLGFLVQFISTPVTAGFTSGAAMTILFSQLKSLFGLTGDFNSFLSSAENLIKNIHALKLWDTILGISTIIILLLLKYLGKYGKRTNTPDFSTAKNILWKFNWIISVSRNAVVVILAMLLAWVLKTTYNVEPFSLTGEIQEGLPSFTIPPFSTIVGNETHSFPRMLSELGTSLITLPLISILESVAIAKAFSMGKVMDATQEMIALGLCNILGSFFKSMPTTGSFTRTAVNNASGVQTQAGGIITGCLVLLALKLLTNTFYFIPKATLAGLIVCAMIFMMEFGIGLALWKTRKIELLIMLLTFGGCLFFGLEIGICIGVASDAVVLLLKLARPSISYRYYKVGDASVLLVKIPRSLNYCAADHVRCEIITEISAYPEAIVVVDGSNMKHIDTTVAKSFKSLMEDVKAKSQQIIFWQFTTESIDIFRKFAPSVQSVLLSEPTVEDSVKSILQAPSSIISENS